MGMSSYVLDSEEKFFDIVAEAVKNAEHVSEAFGVAEENKNLVPHYSSEIVDDLVSDLWDEYWSEYVL